MKGIRIRIRCGRCCRVKLDDQWVPPDHLPAEEQWQPALGYCPACFDLVMPEIKQAMPPSIIRTYSLT